MASQGIIDPTKTGKYPVILSDALLGKPSKETYTGVRYNHRPALSSDTAPASSRLKKSAREGTFNLGFEDQGGKYQYNGTRTSGDGKYILIFEPARQAFVLHRVDSTFHMNLTRTPTDTSAESLRKQFPQLEVSSTPSADSSKQQKGKGAAEKAGPSKAPAAKGKETAAAKDTPKAKAKPEKAKPGQAKAEKNKPEKSKQMMLTLPTGGRAPAAPTPAPTSAAKEKPKRRTTSPVESEEDDDDDDGGLTIEYPGGNPSISTFQPANNFSPAFPAFPAPGRRFSEFARGVGRDEEDEDADAEFDDEMGEDEDAGFKLPSPVNDHSKSAPPPPAPSNPIPLEPMRFTFDDDDEDAEGEIDADGEVDEAFGDDFDADLEAELEKEFHKMANEKGNESDSSVSEEE
ncbi:RNA polymerase II transcription elongation factor-domain-containing protein [Podospora didyma]|uniref:RNA polymerase II transcription elongation factor-domain-containing protein n=1 Tax=Podospora didyma TaxID=330526 RepID=A0AAE0U6S8_9PEZI|nr:RNA polymerase II transcription elongation factor-domain-containing protein [Podospora didyma]